jgi:zinc protease
VQSVEIVPARPLGHAAAVIRRALLLAALILALLAPRPARADFSRPVVERVLPSGLRLVVCPDLAGADVSVMVRYDTGARDEPAGLEGLAHLVEHLLFLSGRHTGQGRFFKLLEQAGAANLNGVTTIDSTTYFETLPPERLELALWLESDRMGHALRDLDEATLERARAEVRNEHRERYLQAPLGAMRGFAQAELFPVWHPYHHLPIGTVESIQRITVADARAFAATWYGPSNAVLVVTGNVDPTRAEALAQRYFGTLPPRPPPLRPLVPEPQARGATIVHVGASVTREEVRLAWVTPAFAAPGDAELDLAASILVDRGAGWLENVLSRAPRLATRVLADQDSMDLASVFEIRATVADGRPMRDVLQGIVSALRRFEQGVSDEEIQRARVRFQNARLFNLETSLGLAGMLAGWARFGPFGGHFDGEMGRYASITPAAVRSAVRRWLGVKPWVVSIGHPTRGRAVGGEVIGRQEVAW